MTDKVRGVLGRDRNEGKDWGVAMGARAGHDQGTVQTDPCQQGREGVGALGRNDKPQNQAASLDLRRQEDVSSGHQLSHHD